MADGREQRRETEAIVLLWPHPECLLGQGPTKCIDPYRSNHHGWGRQGSGRGAAVGGWGVAVSGWPATDAGVPPPFPPQPPPTTPHAHSPAPSMTVLSLLTPWYPSTHPAAPPTGFHERAQHAAMVRALLCVDEWMDGGHRSSRRLRDDDCMTARLPACLYWGIDRPTVPSIDRQQLTHKHTPTLHTRPRPHRHQRRRPPAARRRARRAGPRPTPSSPRSPAASASGVLSGCVLVCWWDRVVWVLLSVVLGGVVKAPGYSSVDSRFGP